MYLYFNENGILKETINDSALRKGNANANIIYCYFEGDPQISSVVFNITPNGFEEPIILNQDSDSPIEANENNPECFVPYDSERKLKYFKYFTPYKFYKCTLTAETLSVAGLWLMTIQAINSDQEVVAMGEYVGMVEDNNIIADTTITYSQYMYLLALTGSKVNYTDLAFYQRLLTAGSHITISDTQVIDVSDVESTLDEIEIETDVSGTLTEEEYAALIHNNFNTLNMDGEKFYLVYKDNEKMIFADYYITTAINWLSTIELTRATREWNLSRLNVSQVNEINDIKARVSALESANEYVATDITSLLNLGITHSASDIYKATMIQTQHQLIFEIKAKGTSNSIPTSDLLSDVISIDSSLGNKLRRFNNVLVSSSYAPSTPSDGRIGSGTFESYFDGNYAFNNIWLVSTAQNELRLYSPNVQQTTLEPKSISIDIRIVIDLL